MNKTIQEHIDETLNLVSGAEQLQKLSEVIALYASKEITEEELKTYHSAVHATIYKSVGDTGFWVEEEE
tara:strand:- start:4707 stop:4913 length:207 start_codon:yes stop_codon:yes gene_type:complete